MKEVIILGSGPSRVLCPWDTEVWAINNCYRQWRPEHKPDKTFLVHKQTLDKSGDPIFNWADMNKDGGEIISLWEIPELKSKPFPYEAAFAISDYMSNTVCYMVAHAILNGYESIRLYGIDMKEGGEYYLEKAGLEWWLGYAAGKGIKVWVAPGSSLLRTPVGIPYGTDENYDAEVVTGRKVKMNMGLLNDNMESVNGVDKIYVKPIWG